ncbi:hypothetical protein [Cryobacterium sp. GrIS_2_6]|uniref:hypothetical protein n=1 Tax=Cryobacterium sp. GrIS_2_6 TaxID=3162785 RepID=UPI002DFEC511|nr:hypothetical protein [Cryobacterium psychrotolerans]
MTTEDPRRKKQPPRSGGRTLGGTLSLVVLAFGYSSMTYRETLKSTGSPAAAWMSVVEIGIWAIVAIVAALVWVLATGQLAERRERRLRIMFPEAIGLRSTASLQLRKALRRVSDAEGNPIVGLGFGSLTLMASPGGIAIWDGWGHPHEVCRWAWADVADIVPATFTVHNLRMSGLEVVIMQGSISTALPFIIRSTGLKGLLAPSLEAVAELGSRAAAVRP